MVRGRGEEWRENVYVSGMCVGVSVWRSVEFVFFLVCFCFFFLSVTLYSDSKLAVVLALHPCPFEGRGSSI